MWEWKTARRNISAEQQGSWLSETNMLINVYTCHHLQVSFSHYILHIDAGDFNLLCIFFSETTLWLFFFFLLSTTKNKNKLILLSSHSRILFTPLSQRFPLTLKNTLLSFTVSIGWNKKKSVISQKISLYLLLFKKHSKIYWPWWFHNSSQLLVFNR